MDKPGEDTLIAYFSGSLEGHEERKLVELYLAMDIDQDYVVRCMRKAAEITGTEENFNTAGTLTEAWHKFKLLTGREPVVLRRRMQTWQTFGLVAAVLCCIIMAVIYLNQPGVSHIHQGQSIASVTTDHAPGKNRAVLILSNGKKIDVTEVGPGQVAKQGTTAIVKTAEGNLVYDRGKQKASIIETALNTLAVPRGGQYSITLPDGTRVWLNAASTLIFPAQFHGNTREVTLRGEAYFEVAKNVKMPFHVKVGEMEVKVLGTHFNIMAYDDEPVMRTTLLEGAVQLTAGNATAFLKPGEEGIMSAGRRLTVRQAEPGLAIAWKNGRFIFNDEDLPSISRKLARWYDVSIIDKRNDKSLTYTGTISRYQHISEVLKMLELTGTMHYRIENSNVTILQP